MTRLTRFARRVVTGVVVLCVAASGVSVFAWGESQELHEQKLQVGFEALKKIISIRNQLKNQLVGLEGKKKLNEKDRKELAAILNSIERFFPYGSGGVCEQTESLVNRLHYLEQEKQNSQKGTWLVPNSKATTRLALVIAGFLALNLAIWGVVKVYYYLREREHGAAIEHGDLQGVLTFFRGTIANGGRIDQERGRMLRAMQRMHGRHRRVYRAFDRIVQ